MTTRRWMVVVAAIAVSMGGFVAVRALWQYLAALERVQYHEGMEALWRWLDPLRQDQSQRIDDTGLTDEQRQMVGDVGLPEDVRAALDQVNWILAASRRKMEYHAAMARKYRCVAQHPWLAVEPDPPEPN
jgi:hypothetical protein